LTPEALVSVALPLLAVAVIISLTWLVRRLRAATRSDLSGPESAVGGPADDPARRLSS
jgi:hypothetical protein